MSKDQRIDRLTKQIPILENVPREERLGVLRQAIKKPVFWGTAIILFVAWFVFFSGDILAMGNIFDLRLGLIKNLSNMFGALLVPVLIPVAVILLVILTLRNYLVKKIVREKYGK